MDSLLKTNQCTEFKSAKDELQMLAFAHRDITYLSTAVTRVKQLTYRQQKSNNYMRDNQGYIIGNKYQQSQLKQKPSMSGNLLSKKSRQSQKSNRQYRKQIWQIEVYQ